MASLEEEGEELEAKLQEAKMALRLFMEAAHEQEWYDFPVDSKQRQAWIEGDKILS